MDNFRAAHDWSVVHDPVEALRLAGSLSIFWDVRNGFAEAIERTEEALEAGGEDAPIVYRADALLSHAFLTANAGSLHDVHGTVKRARSLALEAHNLFSEAGHAEGRGYALVALAWFEQNEDFPQRRRLTLAEDALTCAREAGDDRLMVMALVERALALPSDQAEESIERAAKAARELGATWYLLTLYWEAAHNALRSGDPELAGRWVDHALPLARDEDPVDLVFQPGVVGLHTLLIGEVEGAAAAFEDQLRRCGDLAVPTTPPGRSRGSAPSPPAGGRTGAPQRCWGRRPRWGLSTTRTWWRSSMIAFLHPRGLATANAAGTEHWNRAPSR